MDFLWKNFWWTLVEAFYVIRWLLTRFLPDVFYKLQFMFTFLYALSGMSIAVIVTGWKLVVEKTANNRIEDELAENRLTLDKEASRRKWITLQQHMWVLMGFAINIFIILVMIYGVQQFLTSC